MRLLGAHLSPYEEEVPMPWVQGHYARSRRTGRRYARSPGVATIVLIVLGVILVIYLITR